MNCVRHDDPFLPREYQQPLFFFVKKCPMFLLVYDLECHQDADFYSLNGTSQTWYWIMTAHREDGSVRLLLESSCHGVLSGQQPCKYLELSEMASPPPRLSCGVNAATLC